MIIELVTIYGGCFWDALYYIEGMPECENSYNVLLDELFLYEDGKETLGWLKRLNGSIRLITC